MVTEPAGAGGDESTRPPALRLAAEDNVLVALRDLAGGDRVPDRAGMVEVLVAVPFGHKVAAEPIAPGDPVVKYGEVVGRATLPIARGDHVHVHNVVSSRLPGSQGPSSQGPVGDGPVGDGPASDAPVGDDRGERSDDR
ncbi:MAG: UxaA family hydrolase [Acidimicrobiales bacterium]